MLRVVLAFGAIVSGRVTVPKLKSAAFEPVRESAVTCRSAVPGLLMVTTEAALVVPTRWLANGIEAGLTVIAGAVPVPDKETVCGLPLALSAIESVAERAPVTAVLNVSEIFVLVPGVSVNGAVVLVVKSPAAAP